MKSYGTIVNNKDLVTKEYLTNNTYSTNNPPPGNPYNIDIKRVSVATSDWKRTPLYDTGESGKEAYAATVLCAIPQTAKYVLDVDLTSITATYIPKIKKAYSKISRVFSEDANITLISYDGSPGAESTEAIPLKVLIIKDSTESAENITTFKIQGMYETLDALKAEHSTGYAGNAYAVGTAESNTVYIWDVDRQDWANIGNIQGPQGEPGAQGPKGDPGPGIESDSVTTIEVMTQADYDALTTKNATTLYLIGG